MNKMNNLEIINNEESNSNNIKENKSKSKLIKETIESKGIPILAQEDSQILTAEQYYKTNFPEYKIHKVEPFLFITMGDLTTFSFKKTDNFQPRFSFGPYWFITIMLYFVFYLLTAILYRKIFYKNTSFRIKTFYWLEFSIYIFWFLIFLIQPRIIMNKKKSVQEYSYCSKCNVYYNPYDKVDHCDSCGVCVSQMDHHSYLLGKCIANGNTFIYYLMMIDIGIFYSYIIYCIIVLVIDWKPKNK